MKKFAYVVVIWLAFSSLACDRQKSPNITVGEAISISIEHLDLEYIAGDKPFSGQVVVDRQVPNTDYYAAGGSSVNGQLKKI